MASEFIRVVVDCTSDDDFETRVVYVSGQQLAAFAAADAQLPIATTAVDDQGRDAQTQHRSRKRKSAPVAPLLSEDEEGNDEESLRHEAAVEATPDPLDFIEGDVPPDWESVFSVDRPSTADDESLWFESEDDIGEADGRDGEARDEDLEDAIVTSNLLALARGNEVAALVPASQRQRSATPVPFRKIRTHLTAEEEDEGYGTEDIDDASDGKPTVPANTGSARKHTRKQAIVDVVDLTGDERDEREGKAPGIRSPCAAQTIHVAPFFDDTPRWVDQGSGYGEWRRPSEWPSGKIPDWPAGTSPVWQDGGGAPMTRASTRSQRVGLRNTIPTAASWPQNVIHLADNYNPRGIAFQDMERPAPCECEKPCRVGSCTNAADYIYCSPDICPFGGVCGNGIGQLSALSLHQDPKTREFSVVATEDIEARVSIGQYLGELRFTDATGHEDDQNHRAKNGYRLRMLRDLDHPRSKRVVVDAKTKGSLMRFLNHSCAPTAHFRQVCNGSRHVVVVVTRKAIARGQEITVDYGDRLWFRCRCGESDCRHG